ncbi:hypothetical protein [Actinoplanes friuliensis]|jgi:hypothetical protein|uniref:Uncharacterized protein n=1 Tax=Actinoplanes friuliensis DSM 7358 TaxID=1246995 RepID=U5W1H0_9ACTN|nr:hypothetical protein [Actinoplanes friuliensis]AGZ41825.1 hypothetical protein AFR_17735 [Actinoplanes friuliensis DSM 7358]
MTATVGSSTFMRRLRHRFRFLGGGMGSAVSHADMGPYAGAPRDPELRIGDEKSYSTIMPTHQVTVVATADDRWQSPMPAIAKAREASRKTVI